MSGDPGVQDHVLVCHMLGFANFPDYRPHGAHELALGFRLSPGWFGATSDPEVLRK